MKYFTYSWWAGDNPNEDHVIASKYHSYLASITPDLPSELQRFLSKCCLHDANLLRLDLVLDTRELSMDLIGDHYGDELAPEEKIPSHFIRRFRLTYRGVESFATTGDPKRGLGGPHGYGDWGYDEIEILEQNLYEQRVIFSNGIEFQIRFRDFSFSYEDFDGRSAT